MLSININKLRNEVELREQKKIKIFEKILELCYQRILNSNQKNDDYSCTYIIPTVVFGLPLYDVNDCVTFVINKLIEKGFNIVFAFPTTIHISWKPENKHETKLEPNNQLKLNNSQYKTNQNKLMNTSSNNSSKLSNSNSNRNTQNKYKAINDYKKPETIIYDQNDINLFQSKLDTLFD